MYKLISLVARVSSPSIAVAPRNRVVVNSSIKGKGKGKAIPLQAWTGPEGYRRLRLPDFETIGT